MIKLNIKNYFIISALIISALSMAQNQAFAPSTPDLGTAGPFVILSGSVITNGVTDQLVTGNTGHVSTLDFPFTYVTGRDFVGAPGEFGVGTLTELGTPLGDAHAALVNIGTYDGSTTTGLACDTILPPDVDLATDTTHGPIGQYTPGVYCVNGAAVITAGINFNTAGTYIFKINGELNTADDSTVTFDGAAGGNDANAGNLFWAPVGGATTGANSQFLGTILSGAAAITTGANGNYTNTRLISESAVTIGGGANTFSVPAIITPVVAVIHNNSGCDRDCSPPTIGFGFIIHPDNLVSFSTMPSLSGQDVIAHQMLNERGFRVVNDGLNINGYTVNADSYYSPTPLQTLNVGDQNTVTMKIFEESGPNNVQHAALCIGIPMGGSVTDQTSCIMLDRAFNGEQTVTVNDPKHILQTGVANSVIQGNLLVVTFDFVSAQPLKATKFATTIWDSNRNVATNYYNSGLEIIDASLNTPKNNNIIVNGIGGILLNQPNNNIIVNGADGIKYKLTPTTAFTALDQNNALWKLDKTFHWIKYKNGMSIDMPSTSSTVYRNEKGFTGLKQDQVNLASATFKKMFGNVMNPDFYSSKSGTIDMQHMSRADDQNLQARIAQEKIKAQNYINKH